MADLRALRGRTWRLLAEPTPAVRERSMARRGMARDQPPRAVPFFSPFLVDQSERATAFAGELMRIADAVPGSGGLGEALDHADRQRELLGPDLVNFALMMFITHHQKGRLLAPGIPPLAVREPEKVLARPRAAGKKGRRARAVLPAADGLEWYREDAFANEHHEHWHIVYPVRGIPDGQGGVRSLDRQGELFFYMHQQMLARYDAERLALGLPRVEAFSDYRAPIGEGFDPGPGLAQFRPRQPNRKLRDLGPQDLGAGGTYGVADHEGLKARVSAAIAAGTWPSTSDPVGVDALGATVEPSLGSRRGYGNLHGMGHILSALVEVPDGDGRPGVMADTATAIRDPFFYRWHKHVDDFYRAWCDRLEPHNFGADRPDVLIRKSYVGATDSARSPDIHLVFLDEISGGSDLAAQANAAFGGQAWETDEPSAFRTTDALETALVTRELLAPDRRTRTTLEHLVHREFAYVLRVENLLPRHQSVTVRIFMAPRSVAGDRWCWIEMDKFIHELSPGQRAVITRPASLSSVIRKPAAMQPSLLLGGRYRVDASSLDRLRAAGMPAAAVARLATLRDRVFENLDEFATALSVLGPAVLNAWAGRILDETFLDTERPVDPFLSDGETPNPHYEWDRNFCSCGWPYHLLLPRGTAAGMPFRLMVVLTDWATDRVGPDTHCGSASFCGAQDRYPDRRPMLYPFDRPFSRPIPDVVMQSPHMAHRDFTIRFKELA